MSMVVAASVQNAPDPGAMPAYDEPTPTPYVQAAPTAPHHDRHAQAHPPCPPSTSPQPRIRHAAGGRQGARCAGFRRSWPGTAITRGDIDGVYGNQTRRAVEQFQYQHGLSADGMAGRITLTVLYESNQVRMSPTAVTPAPLRHLRSGAWPSPETPASAAPAAATDTPQPPAAPSATPGEPASTPAPSATSAAPTATPTPTAVPSATPAPPRLRP